MLALGAKALDALQDAQAELKSTVCACGWIVLPRTSNKCSHPTEMDGTRLFDWLLGHSSVMTSSIVFFVELCESWGALGPRTRKMWVSGGSWAPFPTAGADGAQPNGGRFTLWSQDVWCKPRYVYRSQAISGEICHVPPVFKAFSHTWSPFNRKGRPVFGANLGLKPAKLLTNMMNQHQPKKTEGAAIRRVQQLEQELRATRQQFTRPWGWSLFGRVEFYFCRKCMPLIWKKENSG